MSIVAHLLDQVLTTAQHQTEFSAFYKDDYKRHRDVT